MRAAAKTGNARQRCSAASVFESGQPLSSNVRRGGLVSLHAAELLAESVGMSVLTLIGASYGLFITTVLVLGRTAAAADPFVIEAPSAPGQIVTDQSVGAEFRLSTPSSQILVWNLAKENPRACSRIAPDS
jgi:hypothetical protein